MALTIEEKCRARVRFQGFNVSPALWLKWKGRKSVDGWACRRIVSKRQGGIHAGVVFTCFQRDKVGNMTPEKIEEITVMMHLLKEQL
jgi:hypothetical protein